ELPRPLTLPSSESPSEKAMLTPAPMAVATPTRKAGGLLRGGKAAADRGAGGGVEASIKPARAGRATPRMKARWGAAGGGARAGGRRRWERQHRAPPRAPRPLCAVRSLQPRVGAPGAEQAPRAVGPAQLSASWWRHLLK